MRTIYFVTDPIPVKAILSNHELPTSAPRAFPARRPPKNPQSGCLANKDLEQHQAFDPNTQPAPPLQHDLRISY